MVKKFNSFFAVLVENMRFFPVVRRYAHVRHSADGSSCGNKKGNP